TRGAAPALLHRNDTLSSRFEAAALPKLLTIISVAGIVGPGATVALVPVTITTSRAIAPLIPEIGPVIASVAAGICEPGAILMPIPLLVPSTVLIGLVFQTSSVVGVQDAIQSTNHVVQVLSACRPWPRHDRKKTDHPGGAEPAPVSRKSRHFLIL